MLTVIVTVNGSATPSATRLWCFAGSGRFSQLRASLWKKEATTVAPDRAIAPS
jgi:hypothetical protein